MKIKREELVIEIDNARFIFAKPTYQERFKIADLINGEDTTNLDWMKFVLSRLRRVEGVEFDDGSRLDASNVLELPESVVDQVISEYATQLFKALGISGDPEKNVSEAA